MGFPGGSEVKASACNAGDPGRSLGREDPLEKEMATNSSILARRIPWTEEPGGPQSMGLQRVGHDRATSLTNDDLHSQGCCKIYINGGKGLHPILADKDQSIVTFIRDLDHIYAQNLRIKISFFKAMGREKARR